MKPISINKNSIHYKIATNLGGYISYCDDADLCTYMRKLFLGIIVFTFVSVGAFGLAAPIVHFIVASVVSLMTGMNVLDEIAYAGATLLFLPITGIILFMLIERSANKPHKQKIVKPDGFIKTAYKSIKGKYCVRIEFVK